MEAPLDDASVLEFVADVLAHEHAVEGVDVADSAHEEDALVPHLHLDPDARRARSIRGSRIFCDEALVTAFLDDAPGVGTILGQPAARQDEIDAVDDVLKDAPALDERTTSEIARVHLEDIECDEDGRSRRRRSSRRPVGGSG